MDDPFNLAKEIGSAWPVIAFAFLVITAIGRFVWRFVGQRAQTARRARRELATNVTDMLAQLKAAGVTRSSIRDTQLEFRSRYVHASEAERDELTRKWHRLQIAYHAQLQQLQGLVDLSVPDLDGQPDLQRSWSIEQNQIRQTTSEATARGSYGPFSDAAGPNWDTLITRVEAFAGRHGLAPRGAHLPLQNEGRSRG